MRRANGDWFALEAQGGLLVPLFHSSHDAMMARLRNGGMLVFKPVALDAKSLEQMTPVSSKTPVTFLIVKDPSVSLSHGSPIEPSQLVLLIENRAADESGSALTAQASSPRVGANEAH